MTRTRSYEDINLPSLSLTHRQIYYFSTVPAVSHPNAVITSNLVWLRPPLPGGEVRFWSGEKTQFGATVYTSVQTFNEWKIQCRNLQPSQMMLPRIHLSPLGTSEDSPVIKGELHTCNISKSLLAKWKKEKVGERRDEMAGEGGERRLQIQSGFKGLLVVKTKTPFPLWTGPNHEVMLRNGGDSSQLLMSSIWLQRCAAVWLPHVTSLALWCL